MSITSLEITPYGGVGKIGGNITLISFPNGIKILIDCGLQFSSNDFFGVRFFIPDIFSLEEVDAIILTHAHEDHIGAIATICSRLKVKAIFASIFTQIVLEKKIGGKRPNFSELKSGQPVHFPGITLLPFNVGHSTLETLALLISTEIASVIFVSDFKMKTQVDTTFWPEVKKLFHTSKKKVLFLDSTCAHRPGHAPAELDLLPYFKRVMAEAKERIYITFFPSNIERMGLLIGLANELGIYSVLLGRSVEEFYQMAKETNNLNAKNVISSEEYRPKVHGSKVLVLVSGCQGDRYSAFRRLALDHFDTFIPRTGDVFIYSARIIPGNDIAVIEALNSLCEKGVEIITPDDQLVHTSGHGHQEDLRDFISYFFPDALVPVHGDYFHLRSAKTFYSKVFSQVPVFLIKNFNTLVISQDKISQVDGVQKVLLPVQESGKILDLNSYAERKKIARHGAIVVTITTQNQYKVFCSFLGIDEPSAKIMGELRIKLIKKLASLFKQCSVELLDTELRREILHHLRYQGISKPLVKIYFAEE